MLLPVKSFERAYKHIKLHAINTRSKVLVCVTGDCDAISACHIFTVGRPLLCLLLLLLLMPASKRHQGDSVAVTLAHGCDGSLHAHHASWILGFPLARRLAGGVRLALSHLDTFQGLLRGDNITFSMHPVNGYSDIKDLVEKLDTDCSCLVLINCGSSEPLHGLSLVAIDLKSRLCTTGTRLHCPSDFLLPSSHILAAHILAAQENTSTPWTHGHTCLLSRRSLSGGASAHSRLLSEHPT